MFSKKIILGLTFLLSTTSVALSNNLSIEDFDYVTVDTAANTMSFQFNLTQDNSWRSVVNHDAVWIFMKYSLNGGQTWKHASMAGNGINPTGFSLPNNFEAAVPQDEKGFFLRRTDFGSGNIIAEDVQFVWDYGQDGLSDAQAQSSSTIANIYGIEVVYIPEGGFYLGDGNSSSEYAFKQGSADTDPWYISNESSITTTNAASEGFYYTTTGSSNETATGSVFLIPNSFPKGYNDFYLMKYELTEGQWVSFFNTLTTAQKLKRDITGAVEGGKNTDNVLNRNTVAWDSANPALPATTDRPARAMTYISWPDAAAFADWAALRPMTEFEFEKAARGADISPTANEYVWGTTSYDAAQATEIFPDADEDGNESIFDGNANLNRNTLGWSSGDGRTGGDAAGQKGALRVGIFAENSTNRVTSGAGYYGNMELSGNVAEPAVTVGRIEGRQFLGSHGDGNLSSLTSYEGNATNTDWPGINASNSIRGVTGTVGIGYRGGDYQSSSLLDFQISSRGFAANDADSEGFNQRYDASAGIVYGARFARTAP